MSKMPLRIHPLVQHPGDHNGLLLDAVEDAMLTNAQGAEPRPQT